MAKKEKEDYDQMNNFLGLIMCIFLREGKKDQSIDQKEKKRNMLI